MLLKIFRLVFNRNVPLDEVFCVHSLELLEAYLGESSEITFAPSKNEKIIMVIRGVARK